MWCEGLLAGQLRVNLIIENEYSNTYFICSIANLLGFVHAQEAGIQCVGSRKQSFKE